MLEQQPPVSSMNSEPIEYGVSVGPRRIRQLDRELINRINQLAAFAVRNPEQAVHCTAETRSAFLDKCEYYEEYAGQLVETPPRPVPNTLKTDWCVDHLDIPRRQPDKVRRLRVL